MKNAVFNLSVVLYFAQFFFFIFTFPWLANLDTSLTIILLFLLLGYTVLSVIDAEKDALKVVIESNPGLGDVSTDLILLYLKTLCVLFSPVVVMAGATQSAIDRVAGRFEKSA